MKLQTTYNQVFHIMRNTVHDKIINIIHSKTKTYVFELVKDKLYDEIHTDIHMTVYYWIRNHYFHHGVF